MHDKVSQNDSCDIYYSTLCIELQLFEQVTLETTLTPARELELDVLLSLKFQIL